MKISAITRLCLSCLRPRSIYKAFCTFRKDGLDGVLTKLHHRRKSFHVERCFAYRDFLKATRISEEDLALERKYRFNTRPVFAVITPLFNTKPEYLKDLIEGFLAQTYPHFKLFLMDASPRTSNNKTAITDYVKQYSHDDPRIRYQILEKNRTIADNTNVGIQLALSEPDTTHICLCDHDDIIWPNTLFEYAKAINQHPASRIFYSDEDMATSKKDNEAYYIAKPDFSELLLESCNYINHFFVCSRDLMTKIKTKDGHYERPEYNGAQDYDLYLRLAIEALRLDRPVKDCLYTSETICHIPKFLYRWRAADGSTAQNSANKLYAFDAGKRALEDYYRARKIPIESVEVTEVLGTYRTYYRLQKEPLISVIIPNKDHVEDLDLAIKSIQNGTYKNIEFIIIENNSELQQTFEYYNKIRRQKNIRIAYYEGDFNYSSINNFGANYARGELLLFLNNDVEMISRESISEMASIIQRPKVGIVGPQLLYPDNTIQHAGVVVGMTNSANHIFSHIEPEFAYTNRARCVSEYSAVTGACLMIKKSLFVKTGGFDEKLAVALNDTDLCLKIRDDGFKVVYTPYAKFYHYESKTRGLDEKDPVKLARFEKEASYFRKKWHKIMRNGDPYYNPNLSLDAFNCEIRRIPYKKP